MHLERQVLLPLLPVNHRPRPSLYTLTLTLPHPSTEPHSSGSINWISVHLHSLRPFTCLSSFLDPLTAVRIPLFISSSAVSVLFLIPSFKHGGTKEFEPQHSPRSQQPPTPQQSLRPEHFPAHQQLRPTCHSDGGGSPHHLSFSSV
ncbi:hypothetical protein DM02DRAFT_378454 [Periconia macrospinosa]|uniref:Uncharacterized protein n=1 Tax=Periconia macrospinosa TaxID=97972 RepID=A0A2V1E8Q5_9PLEO|nr:hypothetical protein DM02DRAFT_378454 [Periconia macrospinosa]